MKGKKIGYIIAIIVLLLIASAVCSCKSTQYVPVKEIRVDTVYKASKDSIRWLEKTHLVDSIRWRDSTLIKLDYKGAVIYKEVWHSRDHSTNLTDSTKYYKHELDSVMHAKATTIYKDKYVEKKLSWWQKTIQGIGYIGLGAILALGLYFGVRWWRKFNVTSLIGKIIRR
jgi:hypothetical protein